MKIAIIGANGNLGSKVVRQVLDRNKDVLAIVYKGECLDTRATVLEKNLFDLSKEDIQDCDVVISAFGGGFNTDPKINQEAFIKYIQLLEYTNKKFVAIAGEGSLYTDDTHTVYEYQLEGHPTKLKEISKYIRLGIDEIEKNLTFDWTVVCPSRKFDLNGAFTQSYLVGEKGEIIYNEDEQSYVTYEDLAMAMVDIAVERSYKNKVITIASKHGGR